MKRAFMAAVLLFFAASSRFTLEAADKPAPPSSCPDQSQILVKLSKLELDHKQILQQLADMKQELYAIKVRASRC